VWLKITNISSDITLKIVSAWEGVRIVYICTNGTYCPRIGLSTGMKVSRRSHLKLIAMHFAVNDES
jgi:hypothetical protein